MSGLGFSKQEEKTVEPEQDEDDLALHNIQIPVVSSEEVSQERISFSQPAQRYEARKISSAPEQPKEKKEFRQKSSMGISQLGRELINQRKKLSRQLLILQDSRPRKHQKRNQIFLNELLKNIILHNLRKGVKRDLRISQLHQRCIRKLQLQQIL